ncbi:MAG: NADH:ubiquinone reductase (Na(+)-transporting) subunit C [Bacteroidales bacterium]|jgi:Na+-transporting NADH:ubiquinone oxidoreductase subunit C|nr:NADH:ubiquinone reductase (Na(+)-transporting) subunit C [Bacteroidales bacterium]
MKQFTNRYIFIFATAMVAIVALILSTAALLLQPLQQKNAEIEKKRNILASVGVEASEETAENLYDKIITGSFALNSEAEKVDGVDPFEVDVRKEQRKPLEEQVFPIFEASLEDGSKSYIIPLEGKGLWGPLYGYLSLKEDLRTINGVTFDHTSETPGLGAEINESWFEDQFIGKKIFEDDEFVSIEVQKGGAEDDDPHAVDAISGGTITSKGLEAMLYDCIINYVEFLKKNTE